MIRRPDATYYSRWEARYYLAFSLSQWPDFLNKTPAAIREFKTLRQQQETTAPRNEHVQVYLQLARLYGKQGRNESRLETLRAGVACHPGNEMLADALEAATER